MVTKTKGKTILVYGLVPALFIIPPIGVFVMFAFDFVVGCVVAVIAIAVWAPLFRRELLRHYGWLLPLALASVAGAIPAEATVHGAHGHWC